MDASRTGDLEALVKLLHPDIVLRSDGGGVVRAARRPVVGAAAVARLLLGLTQRYPDLDPLPATVNGAPGAVLADGDIMTGAVAYEVAEGQVLSIDLVLAPDKLAWSRAQETV
jgi:RNA polymerase sigma-70 factor, ECF subfamily